ncbi:2-C-methyl-D-erythritol 2,4-cyclodiphosphate synthase [Entomospira nematocerorum]|uniref:2-C-methyl-D-erythritol 2,4-cyclodiphosphate synthase n=1 Tax=Entomospira nematocerorum TaxID=2719987 RepID=A0A968GCG9_9SPIO|nr:2-C-methyl-D-erythritol 2,4-cyclodiphosphate synthase [Entomospira nematocera]NIZ47332.1 2-C-methyl-D-erythritol 2,4-cyclodiphosphate synthase [Entomospira nematocera]WDI34126.1 2-C-methyl-D-erythritol 2,4-cyclodiphosphate synthase [Entomospira nematocera]
MSQQVRIGLGDDVHRIGNKNQPFMIAGVCIAPDGGSYAHSDGDVVLHALIDALLGALALGDIGDYFPPSDPQYKSIASEVLLLRTLPLIRERGYIIGNIDITIHLERPKLQPFKDAMRATIAKLLSVDIAQIGLKAKTSEGVDAVGEGRAISAQVVVLLNKL